MRNETKSLAEWFKTSKPTKRELALLKIIDRLNRRLAMVEYILTEEEQNRFNKFVGMEAE